MIRVGILEAGRPPDALVPAHGSYPGMVERFLGPGYDYRRFDVARLHYPESADVCDAYVITGSAADAFGEAEWIIALKAFLRQVRGKAALVGLCFGHQIMAEAFGGRVARAELGWGIGLHSYAVAERRLWMDDVEALSLMASHRDQVVAKPPRAIVVARSFFCPMAVLDYAEDRAISIQPHPEFERDFAAALVRRGTHEEERKEIALETIAQPNDNAAMARWVRRFLNDAAGQAGGASANRP